VSKTATRRAPGRSAEEIQAAVERFLKASQKPALLEPGEEIIALTAGNFAMEARNSRLTLQAWDDRRNVVRRVVDIRESTPGRLELVAERFAALELQVVYEIDDNENSVGAVPGDLRAFLPLDHRDRMAIALRRLAA